MRPYMKTSMTLYASKIVRCNASCQISVAINGQKPLSCTDLVRFEILDQDAFWEIYGVKAPRVGVRAALTSQCATTFPIRLPRLRDCSQPGL